VAHNSDGTKSVKITAEVGGNVMYGNGSATVTLDKINVTPSAIGTFKISAGFGNYVGLGDIITLKWSGASGTITGYEIQYKRGNAGWETYKKITSTSTSGSTTDQITVQDINYNGAGKIRQYRIRSLNGSNASAWKESNALTMLGGMDLKVSNAWKMGSVWINVNGVWKRAKRIWINVNGTWKYSI
jgi:hypothetical protein